MSLVNNNSLYVIASSNKIFLMKVLTSQKALLNRLPQISSINHRENTTKYLSSQIRIKTNLNTQLIYKSISKSLLAKCKKFLISPIKEGRYRFLQIRLSLTQLLYAESKIKLSTKFCKSSTEILNQSEFKLKQGSIPISWHC